MSKKNLNQKFRNFLLGDIHGEFNDLRRIFDRGGAPNHQKYLFLGDYVDRGPKQLETICLLFACKIQWPGMIFLLRGNHEDASMNDYYGFRDTVLRRFGRHVYNVFQETFNCMPVAAIVEGKMFCSHAGISPDLQNLNQIRNIPRPLSIPSQGLMCDLLWSDPTNNIQIQQFQFNHDRGTSVYYGAGAVFDFCQRFEFDVIVRAHEVIDEGYRLMFNNKCLTIYSSAEAWARNLPMFMNVDADLNCTFIVFRPDQI